MSKIPSRLPFRDDGLLLDELNHRINNEYTLLISTVYLAVRHTENDEVKAALAGIHENLRHYADIHHALQKPAGDARINAEAYLHKLCVSMSRAKLDHKEIELALVANPLQLQSDRCWRLGMIVYELVTNAVRHAFADRPGEIRVELLRTGPHVACKVLDNGSGQTGARPGRGLKIVDELTKSLGGRFKQKFRKWGSVSIVVFPYGREEEERQKEPKRNGVDLRADQAGLSERPNATARESQISEAASEPAKRHRATATTR